MNKSVTVGIVVLFICAATVVATQLVGNGAYHCGRCGIQKWKLNLLWMDFGEPPQDEYGIEGRWLCAHDVDCDHIWLEGPLEESANAYWPALHLMIAKGEDAESIAAKIKEMTDAELQDQDALGRSIMHWLVVYPLQGDRNRLIEIAKSRGVDMAVADLAGLTPKDWQTQCFEAKE